MTENQTGYLSLGFTPGGIEIQIDDGTPFIPDFVLQCGLEYGIDEKQGDGIIYAEKLSGKSIAILDYCHQGMRHKHYYSRGKWQTGTSDMPRFAVWEQLT